MSDVFISYSRLDADFVGKLREALITQNQDVWIDWESIPPSQAWWAEIQKGIAKANNFVIILSPNAMGSPICHLEIEYARQLKKRIIPVLHLPYNRDEAIIAIAKRLAQTDQVSTRDIWGNRQVHDVVDSNDSDLKHINYFTFKPNDNFDARFADLIDIIHTDYAHKEHHTTLHIRALEWDKRNRDSSFLLIENELADAEAWLDSAQGKNPAPTELHTAYIQASREHEDYRTARLAELELKAQKLRREQIAGGITAGVGGLVIGLLIFTTILFIDNVNSKRLEIRQLNPQPNQQEEIQSLENQIASLRLALQSFRLFYGSKERFSLDVALLAIRGLNRAYTPEAYTMLEEVIDNLRQIDYIPHAHQDIIYGILELQDGRLLTYSRDATLKLWSSNGDLITILEGHTDDVLGVYELEDGRLISWSVDNTLRFWSSNGEPLFSVADFGDMTRLNRRTIQIYGNLQSRSWLIPSNAIRHDYENLITPSRHQYSIEDVFELQDGRFISWSLYEIFLWDNYGRFVTSLALHYDTIGVIELRNGLLLSWDTSSDIHIWDLQGNAKQVLKSPTPRRIKGMFELKNDYFIAYTDSDVYLFDSQLNLLKGVKQNSKELEFLNDGHFMVYGGRTMRLYDFDLNYIIFDMDVFGDAYDILELPDGTILSQHYRNQLVLWDRQGELLQVWDINSVDTLNGLIGIQIMPNQEIVLSSMDKQILVLDVQGHIISQFIAHDTVADFFDNSQFGVMVLSNDTILSWAYDGLRIWDIYGNLISQHNISLRASQRFMELPTGYLFSWVEFGNSIYFFNLSSDLISQFESQIALNQTPLFLNNMIIMSDNNSIYTWDMYGNLISIQLLDFSIGQITRLSNGNFFANSRIWSSEWNPINLLFGYQDSVIGVLALDNGDLLSWSDDNTIRVWDTNKSLIDSACEHIFRDLPNYRRLENEIFDDEPTCPQFKQMQEEE